MADSPLPTGFKIVEDRTKEAPLPPGFKVVEDRTESPIPEGFRVVEDRTTEPRSSVIGQASKLAGDALSVFETEQQKFSPEIVSQAKKELAEGGAPPPWMTAAADTVLFGNFAEATAALDSLFMDEPYEKRKQIREAMRQLRQEDAPVQTLVGTLGGFLTPGGAVSAAGKLAKGAQLSPKAALAAQAAAGTAQSAAIEAEEAAEGKELEAIGKSLAFDAVLGVAGAGLGKLVKGAKKGNKGQTATANQVAKITKGDPELAREMADEAAEIRQIHEKALKENASKVSQLDEKELAEIVSLKLALDKDKITDATAEAYNQYRATKRALDEAVGPQETSAMQRGIMSAMDAQYVMNYADRKYGTELAPLMNKVSEKSNKLTHLIAVPRRRAQQISDEMTEDSKAVYDAVEEMNRKKDTDISKLSPDSQKWLNYFSELREQANAVAKAEGLGDNFIKKLSGEKLYIPHKTKGPAELSEALSQKVREITGKKIKQLRPTDAKKLLADKELMDSLSYLNAASIKSGDELLSVLRNPMDTPSMARFNSPKNVLQRTNERVPELIREDDLAKLAGNWINSTFSNIVMRNELTKMRASAQAFREIDPSMASYLNNYVDDQMGMPRGISGWMKEMGKQWKSDMYKKAGETGNSTYKVVGDFPEYLNGFMMNMYPYFLGLRVDALVRNSTQPMQQTATSIGSSLKGDGVKALAPAMFSSYMDVVAKGGKDYRKTKKYLAEKGWLPEDPTPQDWEALNRGIKKTSKLSKGLKGTKQNLDKMAMYLYQEGDVLNRIITVKTADKMAAELLSGSDRGARFFKGISPGYQRKIKRAQEAGDLQGVRDSVSEYLLAHTQFNYNRASLSEFGRYVGSVGSMFSKWPTAILGDTIDTIQAARYGNIKGTDAARQLGRKYLTPFMMLYAADQVYQDEVKENPILRETIGSSLSSYSSATSLTPWLEGTIIQPPVFDVLQDPGKAVSLIPTATYFRFLDERVPRWMNEEDKLITPQIKESIEDVLD